MQILLAAILVYSQYIHTCCSLQEAVLAEHNSNSDSPYVCMYVCTVYANSVSNCPCVLTVHTCCSLQEAVLAKHNSNVDLSSLDEQLSSLQSEKTTVDRAMRDLQEELTRATKQAEVRGAIKELKKDKGKKEEEMATMYVCTVPVYVYIRTYVCVYTYM